MNSKVIGGSYKSVEAYSQKTLLKNSVPVYAMRTAD